jgi:hypothetical protein
MRQVDEEGEINADDILCAVCCRKDSQDVSIAIYTLNSTIIDTLIYNSIYTAFYSPASAYLYFLPRWRYFFVRIFSCQNPL